MDSRKVTVFLYPDEDGRYVVCVPLFPGCTTDGDTPDEALQNAKEAMELLLEDATEDDLEFLDASNVGHAVVGEISVRVPERLLKGSREESIALPT